MKYAEIKNINDVICDDDYMWIMTDDLPCLFRCDYLMQEIELKAIFPEEVNVNCPFSRMVKLGNEIYFIPWLVKEIYYYDIEKNELHKLDICFKDFSSDNYRKTETVVKGEFLYCINRSPDAVIELNSLTKEVKIFQTDMRLYADRLLACETWTAYPEPCVYQEKIIWTNYRNILTVFDMETKEFSVERIEGVSREASKRPASVTEDYVFGIRAFEEALWLFTFEGRVYRYDNGIHQIENKLFEDYAYYDDVDGAAACFLYDMVPLENELYFIPSYQNKCIKYNANMDRYEETINDYMQDWKYNRRNYTICKVINHEKILLYSYYENIFYILDTKQNSMRKWKIEGFWSKFIKENPSFEQAVNRIYMRNHMYDFDDLEWLISCTFVNKKGRKRKLSASPIGEQIYAIVNKV